MSTYNYSYNVLINRLEAFAAGHFLIRRFTHGQIDLADQLQDDQYPFMHVVPDQIKPVDGGMQFDFMVMFADIPRDKEYKAEYQREVISDCIRLGQDLIAEVKNGLQLFGFDVQLVNNPTFEPFMEEQKNTVTGVTFTLSLEVPWDWSACDIPAIWSVGGDSTGGTGTGYGITLQTNGVNNVVQNLLNLEAGTNITITDNGNGTITIDSTGGGISAPYVSTEWNANHTTATGNQYVIGDRVWYNGNVYACIANNDGILPTNASYWTLQSIGYRLRQTPVDWNASSGDYQILNKPTLATVATSGDYNDLSNLPTIPAAQVNSDWNSSSGVSQILNKPTIPAAQIQSDWNQTNPSALDFIKNKPSVGGGGTVTSVGVSVPAPVNPALSVSGSPVTTSGTIAISANGTSSQLIDGTGALQTIPTGLPPTGSAGGDLSGSYPNPNVDRVHGVDFQSGTPSVGDVWLYEGSPAKWQHQQLPAVHVGNDSAVTGSTVKDALNHLNTTKVDSNAAITAGTATKITYDAKGLVTAGTTLAASDIPSGVDAAKIGTGVVSNTEFGYLDGVTSAIQTQLNSKPAKDTTILAYTNTIQIGAGLTTYIPIAGSAAANGTESFVQLAMPYAGTIKNLYVRYNGTQSNTGNLTITTRKNGVNQTLAVTLTNADGALGVKSDTTNSFSVVAGDLINIILVNSATATSGRFVSVSLILERS